MCLVKLYCSVDDFWKSFKQDWNKHFIDSGKPKRGPERELTMPEMMTIVILYHQSNYTFKHFYFYVCNYLKKEFLEIATRFNIPVHVIRYNLEEDYLVLDQAGMEKVIIPVLKKHPTITQADLSHFKVVEGSLTILFKMLPETKVNKVVISKDRTLSDQENQALELAKRIASQKGQSLSFSQQ